MGRRGSGRMHIMRRMGLREMASLLALSTLAVPCGGTLPTSPAHRMPLNSILRPRPATPDNFLRKMQDSLKNCRIRDSRLIIRRESLSLGFGVSAVESSPSQMGGVERGGVIQRAAGHRDQRWSQRARRRMAPPLSSPRPTIK